MNNWQQLIGAVIIGVAIIVAALILSDAIRYMGDAINAGFTFID